MFFPHVLTLCLCLFPLFLHSRSPLQLVFDVEKADVIDAFKALNDGKTTGKLAQSFLDMLTPSEANYLKKNAGELLDDCVKWCRDVTAKE